jgi:hypothetical protein
MSTLRSIRNLTAGALMPLALSACLMMSAQRKDEADETAADAYQKCENLRLAGVIKSHVGAIDCALPQVQKAYQVAAYPFDDLIYISVQARRFGARKVDSGEISDAEYQSAVQEMNGRLKAEEKRRLARMNLGGDPKPEGPDEIMRGLTALMPTPAAAALPPPPKSADCVPIVGIRQCN